jgi:hypothetical protein
VIALRSSWIKLVVAGALPLVISAAWIPLRDRLPNTDLALLLVLVIGTVGWLAGPLASLVSAVVAAVAFDVMDTRPYGALTMSRGVDITTALILLATGLLVGAGGARLGRYQKSGDQRTDALAIVMEASSLVATGEEQPLITEALGAELSRALDLVACEFHARPPNGTRPLVSRDGSLVGLLSPAGSGTSAQIDLPIWCHGQVVAHYRLTLGPRRPSREELRVALSLADQAGAAMASTHPDPPPRPAQRLRLLAPRGAPAADSASPPPNEVPRPPGRPHRLAAR